MHKLWIVGAVVGVLLGAAWVDACCMVPADYRGDVDQRAQQVTILHHDGHQELVVRVSPYFKGVEELPGYLAWVVTVPSKPTAYKLADRGVFDQARNLNRRLQHLAERQERQRSRFSMPYFSLGSDAAPTTLSVNAAAGGLDVSSPIRVGPYEITEVKASGMEAMEALNRYLEERAFPQEDPAHMRWFIENGFTFLCIYIRPPEGQDKLGKKLDLEPLQIGFDTPRPYYPGMFSSQQGNFALRLTTITSAPIERRSLGDIRRKLAASSGEYRNLWTEQALPVRLQTVAAAAPSFGSVKRWYTNSLVTSGFNVTGSPSIADWTEDVRFTLGDQADEPPDWYYGDRDISGTEQFWREHRYAAMVLLVLVVLFFLIARRILGKPKRRAIA